MQALAAIDPNPGGPDRALKRLRTDVERHAHDVSVCSEACGQERSAKLAKRATNHRLESELLTLSRELAAAKRIEATAQAAAASSSSDTTGSGGDGGTAFDELPISDRATSREAVKQQLQQLEWRANELAALEEKLVAATTGKPPPRPAMIPPPVPMAPPAGRSNAVPSWKHAAPPSSRIVPEGD